MVTATPAQPAGLRTQNEKGAASRMESGPSRRMECIGSCRRGTFARKGEADVSRSDHPWHHTVMSFAPTSGETVLWHERRAPPYPQLVLALALMAAIACASVTTPSIRIALAALALGFAGLTYKLRGAGWVEDFTLTDQRIVVRRRDGSERWVALAELRVTRVLGPRVSFLPTSGEGLVLGHVNQLGRLLRALAAAAPAAGIEHQLDALCPT